jgi:DNA primase
MSLLDLLPGLKRAATTNGGEWAGPCPFCGGRDRFRVWPNQGTTGRYWCRGCGKQGDAIHLLRDKDGLTYRDACATLGVMPSLSWKPGNLTRPTPTTWTPRAATTPGAIWTDRAGAFLEACQGILRGPGGTEARAFLTGRGLKSETIECAGLGWNPGTRNQSRQIWGFPPKLSEKTGKPLKVWIPRGLVIPIIEKGRIIRLRVRRLEPGADPPYVIVSGSASSPLLLGTGTAWVVVESELDAFLLRQEAGDLVGVIGLGSNITRPGAETDQALKDANLILVALDSDEPGAKEAWQWWPKHYPNARRWPCPVGKDPTEAKQAGLDLRAWVMEGLSKYQFDTLIEPEPTTEPAQSAPLTSPEPLQSTQTEKTYKDKGSDRMTVFEPFPAEWKTQFDEMEIERLAIMTVCGGLSDVEAYRIFRVS